jgi:hypothetical protein
LNIEGYWNFPKEGNLMWNSDEVEIVELLIRGREYDPKFFGVQVISPPSQESPYWLIEFKDGTKMATNDAVSVRIKIKEDR